jgi:hypothetical protein
VQDITEGTKTAEFVYNADHQRIRMTLKQAGRPPKPAGTLAAVANANKLEAPSPSTFGLAAMPTQLLQ